MKTAYRVAAVAEFAGVTVRTLHHYDDIGLLKPSKRTPSGHRLYSRDRHVTAATNSDAASSGLRAQ